MKNTTKAPMITVSSAPSTRNDEFQFARQEAYARFPPFLKTWSASDIILESIRQPGHCPHVTSPKEPVLHYGAPPAALPCILAALEEQSKKVEVLTSKGVRRQRSDTPILIALVASLPYPPSQRNRPEVKIWIASTIQWLLKTYGETHLISVIEHIDEGYIHLHAFVHNHGKSVKPLMAGHKEVIAAKASGGGTDKPSTVYRAAMVKFQDDYHAAVCAPLGIARKSATPRPRLSRTAYLARRADELDLREKQVAIDKRRLEEEQQELAIERSGLNAAHQNLMLKRQNLARSWKRFRSTIRTTMAMLRKREEIVVSKEEAIVASEASLRQRWAEFKATCITVFQGLDAVQKGHFRSIIEKLIPRR